MPAGTLQVSFYFLDHSHTQMSLCQKFQSSPILTVLYLPYILDYFSHTLIPTSIHLPSSHSSHSYYHLQIHSLVLYPVFLSHWFFHFYLFSDTVSPPLRLSLYCYPLYQSRCFGDVHFYPLVSYSLALLYQSNL